MINNKPLAIDEGILETVPVNKIELVALFSKKTVRTLERRARKTGVSMKFGASDFSHTFLFFLLFLISQACAEPFYRAAAILTYAVHHRRARRERPEDVRRGRHYPDRQAPGRHRRGDAHDDTRAAGRAEAARDLHHGQARFWKIV